ncbi:hypothetical protein BUALT_Bualt08G0049900 [Buddleja alternifolia]|uniref:Myb/SANT-like domain-containing protein n=1 Tax=Buddleja alternifolia TaxID=168488 RepID=A0AAV6X7T5_9LAMI|nr:hypothetical protein BUALT_Bualt08G0049900 [Buddleja alternifolia]
MDSHSSQRISQSSSQLQHSQSNDSIRRQRGKNVETTEKASWDLRTTEIFIKICVEELLAGNRPGSHFNKTGWDNLVRKFTTSTNRNYTRIQLKNRWDSLKKEWGIWKRLLRGESGLGWNNEKGTIEATPDWWQRKIQEVPDAAKYREKGPILLEDQEMLFSDVVATGASAWTPSSGILPPHLLDELDESSDVQFHNFNDHVNEPNAETDATTNTQAESGPIGGNRRGSAEFSTRIRGKKIKKMSNGDKIVRCLERMVGTLETDSSLSNSSKEHGQQYSIKDCLDILEEMSGIEEGDTMWMYATRLFLKPSVREMFLAIKKNETRLRWLQDQMERDMQRRPSSTTSAHASRGVSDNDIASS